MDNINNNANANANHPQARYWHGNFGDRYEHHNVWVRGGPPQPYRRPSGSSYVNATSERPDSDLSDVSTSTAGNHSPPIAPERRKSSSHGLSNLFESLTNQKRNSDDGNLAARRQSWSEQSQQGGFLSKWWDGYTRGK